MYRNDNNADACKHIDKEIKLESNKQTNTQRKENKQELGLTCLGWTSNWSTFLSRVASCRDWDFHRSAKGGGTEESPAMCFYPTGGKGNTA